MLVRGFELITLGISLAILWMRRNVNFIINIGKSDKRVNCNYSNQFRSDMIHTS